MEVSHVSPDLARSIWSRFQVPIERALSRGCGDSVTSAQMLEGILTGRLTLWAVHEGEDVIAVIVMSVHTYPSKVTLVVELLAGKDMDQWVDQVEPLLRDCRDLIGADTIESMCRAGLAKRLGKRGWHRKAVCMELK